MSSSLLRHPFSITSDSFLAQIWELVALYLAMTNPGLWTPLVLGLGLLQDGFAMGAPIGLHGAANLLVYLIGVGVSGRISFRSDCGHDPGFRSGDCRAVESVCLDRDFRSTNHRYGDIMSNWFLNGLITAPFGPLLYLMFDRISRWSDGRKGGTPRAIGG